MPDSRFTWNARARRFVDRRGRFVPPTEVRGALDDMLTSNAEAVGRLTGRLQSGEITVAEWQRGMASHLRDLHVVAATAARGGSAPMKQGDYAPVESRVREQMDFLRRFAAQVESGEQPLDGRFVQRSQMYAQAARGTFEQIRRLGEIAAGMTEERLLTHSMEGCDECAADESRGWVPIDTLGEIGSRTCVSNCLCTFEYRAGDGSGGGGGGNEPPGDGGGNGSGSDPEDGQQRVPNAESATIHDRKLSAYLLNPSHEDGGPKCRFLLRFGFDRSEPQTLREALLRHVRENRGTFQGKTPYGRKWKVRGRLISPDGRNPDIASVWQIDHDKTYPRFITITDLDQEES